MSRRILPILVIVLALSARMIPGPRTIDDSYITYRYARNILAGTGFVYNPGERVLGTTTPLYTGLMTVLGLFGGGAAAPFPEMAMLMNAVFDALTCLLLLGLGRRFEAEWAGLGAALAWAVLPFSVTFAIGGLETSLFVLLLTATVLSYLGANYIAAAFLAALSLLTRPDALILVGPMILDRLLAAPNGVLRWRLRPAGQSPQPIGWGESAALLLPTVGWSLFASWYFGSPLPHSITAKAAAYQLEPLSALVRLLQHYATPFIGHLSFGTRWISVGIILFPFCYLVGARKAIGRHPRSWPWLVFPWLYFAAYAIANPLIFRWYLTPPLVPYLFLILVGAEHLLERLRAALLGRATRSGPEILAGGLISGLFIVGLPLVMVLRGWQLMPDHGLRNPAPEMAWYELELLYRQAAESLREDIAAQSPAPVLAAGDVGVLGYYTSARILDTIGLNSPQSIPYYPTDSAYYVNAYAVSPDLILDSLPDYVVLLEVYGREGLFKNTDFENLYVLRHKIPTNIYESDGMLIFERRPSSR